MNITMCMHYISNLLTMVYKVYEPPIEIEDWGQWCIIDEYI